MANISWIRSASNHHGLSKQNFSVTALFLIITEKMWRADNQVNNKLDCIGICMLDKEEVDFQDLANKIAAERRTMLEKRLSVLSESVAAQIAALPNTNDKADRIMQIQSYLIEEIEVIEKEKQIGSLVLEDKLTKCYDELIKNDNVLEDVRTGLNKAGRPSTDQDVKAEIKEWIKVLAGECAFGFSKNISVKNWSNEDADTARRIEASLAKRIENLGSMAPDNPEGKPINFYLWSGAGKTIAEERAKQDKESGEIAVVFQNTVPGKVINHVMSALVDEGVFGWTSENVKFIYQGASLNLAKLVTPQDNVVICTPTVNASSIFFTTELQHLQSSEARAAQVSYYCLTDDEARKYFKILNSGEPDSSKKAKEILDKGLWHQTDKPSYSATHDPTTTQVPVRYDTLTRVTQTLKRRLSKAESQDDLGSAQPTQPPKPITFSRGSTFGAAAGAAPKPEHGNDAASNEPSEPRDESASPKMKK
jgi:hypothetical protein